MAGLVRKLWRIAAGVLAALVILLAVAIGLVRLALVQVPEYRDQIESWASAAIGRPVEISTIDARLGWHGPELRFTDARLLTEDRAHTLIRSASGSMQIDAWSLLRGRPLPGAVSFSGVALRVERSPDGRWRLRDDQGPTLPKRPRASGAGFPQLRDLPPGELLLQDVTLEVEDLQRGRGPWVVQVDGLEMRLGGGELSVTATGALPAELGGQVALSAVVSAQDARGRPSQWTAGLSFAALNLPAVGEAFGRAAQLPARGRLDGNLSAAMNDGRLERIAGDLQARDLLPPPDAAEGEESDEGPVLQPLQSPFARLATSLEWTQTDRGWQLRLERLDVERGGRAWQSPAAALVFETEERVRRVELRADQLQLEDLAIVAPWLPPDARSAVEQLAPAGTVRNLEMHLDLPEDEGGQPEIYLAARFEGVSLAPWARWPGMRNVTGRIAGDLFGGAATLDSPASGLDLPWMFRAPLEFDDLKASVEWVRNDGGLTLRLPRLELANADAVVDASGRLEIPPEGASPVIDIEAVARQVRLEAGPRYLPVNVLSEALLQWLDAALVSGRVDEARLVLRGPTRQFPFREGDGLFRVEFDLEDGVLDFDPRWPDATAIQAAVRFENEGLWAEVADARLLEVAAGSVSVAVPDFREALLLIEGGARGSLGAFREFVLSASLLERILGPGLEPASMIAGDVAADVRLDLPLKRIADSRAQVDLQISRGAVAFGFLGEPLRNLEARLSIDNSRVTSRRVSATLAGAAVVAEVVTTEQGTVRVEGGGQIDTAGLARVLRLPLQNWVSGAGDWSGFLQFPGPRDDAPLQFEISSSLVGFAIALPEPFRKAAPDSRALVARGAWPSAALLATELEWDGALRVEARIDQSGDAPVLAPVPGAVEGDPTGAVFSGAVKRLDLVEWLRVDWPEGVDAAGVHGAVAGGRVLVGELSGPALELRDALLNVSRRPDGWQVGVAAERAAGEIDIPFELYGDVPVMARMERLWLGKGEPRAAVAPDPADAPPPTFIAPGLVPPLDVEIEDMRLGGVRFGHLSARVLHEGDGFELIGLESVGDGFLIQAEGRSRLSETVDASHLGLQIHSENVGATLEFMGFRRGMEANDGRFESRVEWQGGLRSDWFTAMSGTASITIQDGRLVGVEPGAGRVFGLLSVQALPRRLALDFKDVFGEGTSFDRITGNFDLIGGSAYTDDLVMEGPSANMIVVGRTGLVARDYDQTVIIGADLGQTLPVAGAVVGGPAVGAALYLLSEIFRKPFQAQITYRLTGTIENPVIERVSAGTLGPAQAPPPTARPEPAPAQAPAPEQESVPVEPPPPGGQ